MMEMQNKLIHKVQKKITILKKKYAMQNESVVSTTNDTNLNLERDPKYCSLSPSSIQEEKRKFQSQLEEIWNEQKAEFSNPSILNASSDEVMQDVQYVK